VFPKIILGLDAPFLAVQYEMPGAGWTSRVPVLVNGL